MPQEYTPAQKQLLTQHVYDKISQHGIKSYSMDQLALDLHISKKTVYKYYTNKKTLIEMIVNQFTDQLFEISLPVPSSFAEVTAIMHTTLVQGTQIGRTFSDGFVNDLQEVYPDVYQEYQNELNHFSDRVVQWLNHCAADNLIASIDNEVFALITQTMLPVIQNQFAPEQVSTRLTHFEELLIKLLRP